MVPLGSAPALEAPLALRRLTRDAVDLNLKRTLMGDEDPFGRAVLLWTCLRHREQLVNLERLVAWARAYSRAVLVEGRLGRKRDEALTAALLAAAALKQAGSLSPLEVAVVRAAAAPLVENNIVPGCVPFDSPAYGAAMALACYTLGIDLPGDRDTLRAVVERYLVGGRLDRPAGLALVAYALAHADLRGELQELRTRSLQQLGAAGVGHEARAYLAQAAWVASDVLGAEERKGVAPLVAETLKDSPVYEVLATGQDVVGADGPEGEVGRVSRLYLAAVHDLAAGYEQREAEMVRLAREARYTNRAGHAWLSFVGVAALTLAPAGVATWLAAPFLSLAVSLYWRQQFWSATDVERLSSALVAIAWSCLLVVVASILEVALRLARRQVVSDAHLLDEVRRVLPPRLWKWALAILAGLVAVGWNLTSTSVQAPTSPSPPTQEVSATPTPAADVPSSSTGPGRSHVGPGEG